jgi:hypothetical protein
LQSAPPELPDERVDVIGGDDHGLPEHAVAGVTGQEEGGPVAFEGDEARVAWFAIDVHRAEVEHAGVEGEGTREAATANGRDDGHGVVGERSVGGTRRAAAPPRSIARSYPSSRSNTVPRPLKMRNR